MQIRSFAVSRAGHTRPSRPDLEHIRQFFCCQQSWLIGIQHCSTIISWICHHSRTLQDEVFCLANFHGHAVSYHPPPPLLSPLPPPPMHWNRRNVCQFDEESRLSYWQRKYENCKSISWKRITLRFFIKFVSWADSSNIYKPSEWTWKQKCSPWNVD